MKKKLFLKCPSQQSLLILHQTEAESCLRGFLHGQPTQPHFLVAFAIMYWVRQFPARLSLSCAGHTETPMSLSGPTLVHQDAQGSRSAAANLSDLTDHQGSAEHRLATTAIPLLPRLTAHPTWMCLSFRSSTFSFLLVPLGCF